MRVLVACEFSGVVRDAFRERGHDAWSCDLLPSENGGQHIQGDALDAIKYGMFDPMPHNLGFRWDLMIAHPPCTYLTVTGNKWMKPEFSTRFPYRHKQREDAATLFLAFMHAPIPKVAVENPVGIMSTRFRRPDQVIHPYHFGDSASKATCLWLRGLPKLAICAPLYREPQIVGKGEFVTFASGKRMAKWYADAASHDDTTRASIRNKTFSGIAEAMAEQWSLS